MNESTKTLVVLIVEDMESDAQLIVRLFKKAGYELVYEQVETAGQMRAALEKQTWDIVISDYKLPQFSGRAALQLLQELRRDIPFIVVSGTIGEATAVAMMKAGAHDYLTKGDLGRLVPAVERELKQSEIRRERRQAQDALAVSETELRALVEQVPAIVYTESAENRATLYISPQVKKLTGYTPTEWIKDRDVWKQMIHPEDLAALLAEDERTTATGEPFDIEYRILTRDGRTLWLRDEAALIKDQSGTPLFWQGVMYDITERKQAEDALRASDQRYHSLFDRMLDGMYLSTHAGKFVDVNPAMVKMFGYSSKDEMLEVDIKNELYFSPDERGSHLLDTGQQEFEVYRMRRKDGSEIWVEDSGSYIHDEQGRITFHEGIMRDVTERMQAEKALRASEERFHTLYDNVTIGLYRTTPDGRILMLSPAGVQMLGYVSFDEIAQRNLEQAGYEPGYSRKEFREKLEREGVVIGLEGKWTKKDGSAIFVRESVKVFRNENGEVLYYDGSFEDITAYKQAEEALYASEVRYRTLIEQIPAIVYIDHATGDPGNSLYVSPQIETLLGITPDEWLQEDLDLWLNHIHPDDRTRAKAEYLRGFQSGEKINCEYRMITTDGRLLWIRDQAMTIRDVDGRPSLIQGVMYDITAYKQAEESLRMSEARYRELFNSMLDGFALHEIICDENGKPVDYRFLEVNPAFERLTGLQSANLIGRTVLEVLPRTESYWIDFYGNVALTGRSIFFENYSGELGHYFEVSAYCPRLGQFAVIMADVTERKRAEEGLHQHVRELETLYQSGLTLGQLLNPKEIGQKILELLEEKLDWHHTTIRQYHAQDESLELLAFNQPGAEGMAEESAVEERFNRLISRPGDGLSGWAVQHSQTVRSGDVRNDPRYIEIFPGLHSGLYVPIKLGERMLGVISIESKQPDAFSETDERLVTTLANQAASAFENARLFEETRQRVRELEMLYQSGLALSQLLDPNEIGQKILELLKENLNWRHTGIIFYRPQDDHLALLDFNQPGLKSEAERLELVERLQTLVTRYMSDWAIQQGRPVRAGDVSIDPLYIEAYSGIRSGLYVPMKLGENILGVISIEDKQPDAFSDADERLVTTLANQAASAFENARLFEETRRRVMELETLSRISLALRAVAKQAELLDIVLDEALAILNTSHGSIELWDEDSGNLQKTITRGWLAEVTEPPQNSGEGIVGKVYASGEFYITREFASDPVTRAAVRNKIPPGWGGICLPIRTAQQTLGVMIVSVPGERELNKNEIRLLATLSEMTGAALHRMRLFDETTRRAGEFASLYETSKALSAENNLKTLLQSIVEHAQALLHSADSGIYLYDEQHQELELAVYTGHYVPIGTRQKFDEGVTGRVAQTRQPLRVDDYSTWESRLPEFEGAPFRAVMDVPMLYRGELIGVLVVNETGDSTRKFTEADERLLTLFASQAAGAIHSARLHKETVQRLEHLQSLRVVDQAIASSLDMRLTLNILLTHTISQLNVDAADVLLLHPDSNLLELMAGRGFHTLLLESIGLSDSLAGRAIMEHRTIMTLNSETVSQYSQVGKLWREEGFSAYWCVPLIVKGAAMGVLEVYRRTAFTPDPEWLEFLETLAGQAAIAIENTQLFENLQSANLDISLAYNATIEGWSHALDLRDKETEGHTLRVTDLTVAVAKVMGITDQGMSHIRRGALLHDIGKMGIPDQILHKPDKLTDEEWVIMRTHPQLARDLLMPIAYLREALDIPYSHHEKWDGTGYPQGLKGNQIPLSARLFAIVDVWDALTSDRPYRKKWTKKKALAYIHEQRGKHFDPQVVDAFIKIIKKK